MRFFLGQIILQMDKKYNKSAGGGIKSPKTTFFPGQTMVQLEKNKKKCKITK